MEGAGFERSALFPLKPVNLMETKMSEYPKCKYSADKETKTVNCPASEEALGDGWFDTPRAAGWLGEEEAKKAAEEKQNPAPVAAPVGSEALEALQKQVEEITQANVDLEKSLEEAEDNIERLEALVDELNLELQEARKNDHRDEDGKFTEAPEEEGKEGEEVKQPDVSVSALKLAEENGIDLKTVTGTGAEGKITKPDVQAAIEAKTEAEEETQE